MTLLLRDQHDLHRALDQAGVPADGRTLSFQLASHDQQFPGSGPSNAGGLSLNSGSAGPDGGNPDGGGPQGGGPGGRNRGRGADGETAAATFPAPHWISSALDITA
jgi:hypothetical protein